MFFRGIGNGHDLFRQRLSSISMLLRCSSLCVLGPCIWIWCKLLLHTFKASSWSWANKKMRQKWLAKWNSVIQLLLFLSCGDIYVLSYAQRIVRLICNCYHHFIPNTYFFSSPRLADWLWTPPSLMFCEYLGTLCRACSWPLSCHLVLRLRMCGTVPPDLNDVHRNNLTFICFAQISVTPDSLN